MNNIKTDNINTDIIKPRNSVKPGYQSEEDKELIHGALKSIINLQSPTIPANVFLTYFIDIFRLGWKNVDSNIRNSWSKVFPLSAKVKILDKDGNTIAIAPPIIDTTLIKDNKIARTLDRAEALARSEANNIPELYGPLMDKGINEADKYLNELENDNKDVIKMFRNLGLNDKGYEPSEEDNIDNNTDNTNKRKLNQDDFDDFEMVLD